MKTNKINENIAVKIRNTIIGAYRAEPGYYLTVSQCAQTLVDFVDFDTAKTLHRILEEERLINNEEIVVKGTRTKPIKLQEALQTKDRKQNF